MVAPAVDGINLFKKVAPGLKGGAILSIKIRCQNLAKFLALVTVAQLCRECDTLPLH
ncbi:hypothetical protein KSC_070340 [Ktedonobacter sp. SOSP1-52]|nr:hypothetical protein KSC_070340 [Ktedonobacter sp. SOSP1-52]